MTLTSVLFLAVSGISFFLSASAGLGGSLILVPALALLVGPKQGIALASVLLAANNFAKVAAYRKTIPWRQSAGVVILLAIGAAMGAWLLVAVAERWVYAAVLVAFSTTFLLERMNLSLLERLGASLLALVGGLSSGFSGTSGPMKGLALRALRLNRFYFLGAASLVSLVGDVAKATVFTAQSLINSQTWPLLLATLPLMVLGTALGYVFNTRVNERVFGVIFWGVMAGYATRLVSWFAAP